MAGKEDDGLDRKRCKFCRSAFRVSHLYNHQPYLEGKIENLHFSTFVQYSKDTIFAVLGF